MGHYQPLTEKYRPRTFTDFIGQKHLFSQDRNLLLQSIEKKKPVSCIFYGPPGCGKTTLAELYLQSFSVPRATLHAAQADRATLKEIIDRAEQQPLLYAPTMLWIDEVHRLNKIQQDLLLHSVERGSIILVAATTENPSIALRPALLSRVHVWTLSPLEECDLYLLIERVQQQEKKEVLEDDAKKMLCRIAGGDARFLLKRLEEIVLFATKPLSLEALSSFLDKPYQGMDLDGEMHYQLISALHKAVRGSDCDAALYWLERALLLGEDGSYIARRIVRMAAEDIGLADPNALQLAVAAMNGYATLGSPEGDLLLAEAIVYLALAPKSNALYSAEKMAKQDAEASMTAPVPKHLINAATSWMKKEGYGKGYCYEHGLPGGVSGQKFFPKGVEEKKYYTPVLRGFERELEKRITYFKEKKEQLRAMATQYE